MSAEEPMTKDRMRELLAKIGWSQHECSRRLQCNETVVRKMCRGKYDIPPNVGAWLEWLADLPQLRSLPEGWPPRSGEAWDWPVKVYVSKSPLLRAIGWTDAECSRRLEMRPAIIRKMTTGEMAMHPSILAWLQGLAALPELRSLPDGWRVRQPSTLDEAA